MEQIYEGRNNLLLNLVSIEERSGSRVAKALEEADVKQLAAHWVIYENVQSEFSYGGPHSW
jgi:hypothetical protein